MKFIISPILSVIVLAGLLVAPLLVGSKVSAHHCFDSKGANISECLDTGACLDTSASTCPDQAAAGDKVNSLVATIVKFLSFIVGIVSVIMIIIGGFKYITSAGESSNLSSAKNTILYALVGLVIVALAQILVKFVLNKTTGPAPCPPGQSRPAEDKPCQ